MTDFVCPKCGDDLYGDGYKSALHCPSSPEALSGEIDSMEPDAGPFYCDFTDTQSEDESSKEPSHAT